MPFWSEVWSGNLTETITKSVFLENDSLITWVCAPILIEYWCNEDADDVRVLLMANTLYNLFSLAASDYTLLDFHWFSFI